MGIERIGLMMPIGQKPFIVLLQYFSVNKFIYSVVCLFVMFALCLWLDVRH